MVGVLGSGMLVPFPVRVLVLDRGGDGEESCRLNRSAGRALWSASTRVRVRVPSAGAKRLFAAGESEQNVACYEIWIVFQPASGVVDPTSIVSLPLGKLGDQVASPIMRSPFIVDEG